MSLCRPRRNFYTLQDYFWTILFFFSMNLRPATVVRFPPLSFYPNTPRISKDRLSYLFGFRSRFFCFQLSYFQFYSLLLDVDAASSRAKLRAADPQTLAALIANPEGCVYLFPPSLRVKLDGSADPGHWSALTQS